MSFSLPSCSSQDCQFLSLDFDFFLGDGDEDRNTLFILSIGLEWQRQPTYSQVCQRSSGSHHPVRHFHSQAVDQVTLPAPILPSLFAGSKPIPSCLPVLLVLTSGTKISECSSSSNRAKSKHCGKPNSWFHEKFRGSLHHGAGRCLRLVGAEYHNIPQGTMPGTKASKTLVSCNAKENSETRTWSSIISTHTRLTASIIEFMLLALVVCICP